MPAPAGPKSGTPFVFAPRGRGRVGNAVGLPDDGAGRRVERRDAAPERAAAVVEPSAADFFAGRGHRHEHAAVVHGRRAGDGRVGMLVDLPRPELTAGVGVHGVGRGAAVAKVERIARGARTGARTARRSWRFSPPRARGTPSACSRCCASSAKTSPRSLAGEHPPADHGRLGARREHARETERPLQPQLRHVRGREARLRRRLEARVDRAVAPPVPARLLKRGCAERRRARHIVRRRTYSRRSSCARSGTPPRPGARRPRAPRPGRACVRS